jgi:hypothetical protein
MRKTMAAGMLTAVALAVFLTPARGVEAEDINRAIDRGIAALKAMQTADGYWPADSTDAVTKVGATALAGLTLLECNISGEDPSVARAAEAVRAAVLDLRNTYSLALSVLFLDRLGDPKDIPLIELMGLRLVAGQGDGGGWSYRCPEVIPRKDYELQVKRQVELIAGGKIPRVGEGARPVNDLPAPIQEGLKRALATANYDLPQGGDNSNTQFAALGLWTARRYGIPVELAMNRLERRFREGQNPDGGWSYQSAFVKAASTPTMTCAGILALEISYSLVGEGKKARDPAKDQQMTVAMSALAQCIGQPIAKAAGKDYYFLWSVERVCVILHREKVGNTDWYKWGSAILVKSQDADGLWRGDYAKCGADTCFALLFLRRANLARDLSAKIRGRLGDRALRAGSGKDVEKRPGGEPANEKNKPQEAKPLPELGDSPKERLAKELIGASEGDRPGLLRKFTAGRGPEYTDALALAAARLEGDAQAKTREALANRLVRMQPKTLVEYLKDEDAEMRRAAAKACGMRRPPLRSSIPALVKLLRDPQESVIEAAHESLKTLAGGDLGTKPEPWEEWLKKLGK